jgi:transposase
MRYFGIDIASEAHVAFAFNDSLSPLLSSFSFSESEEGYLSLLAKLGSSEDVLIGMEATGHYW